MDSLVPNGRKIVNNKQIAWKNLNKKNETSKCETLKFNANNLKQCPTSVKLDDLKYQPKNQMKLDDSSSPTKNKKQVAKGPSATATYHPFAHAFRLLIWLGHIQLFSVGHRQS
jgi:hypothetical protein